MQLWWLIIVLLICLCCIYECCHFRTLYPNITHQKNKVVSLQNKLLCNKHTDACEGGIFVNHCCVTNLQTMYLDVISAIGLVYITSVYAMGINALWIPNNNTIQRLKLLEKENYMVMPMAGNNAYCIYFSPMNKLYIIIREFLPTNTSEFIEVNTFGLDVYIQKSSLSRIYQTIIPPLKLTTTKTSRNHEYGIDRCYIINTKSRTDRLAHTVNELDKHNLFGITVEGVEGTTIDFDKLICNGIYKPDSRMGMCANQIACFMSHLKAIKEIAKLPDHVKCLIVEDDVVFLNEFDKYGRLLNQDLIGMDTYWDIIMFGSRRQNIKDPFTKTTIPYLYETGLVLGTWAYMLNGRSARHIISKIYPFSLPLDVTITIQSKHTPSSYTFDDRFLDNLKKFVIHTGNTFDNERFGIINELSSFVWIDSTSSPT